MIRVIFCIAALIFVACSNNETRQTSENTTAVQNVSEQQTIKSPQELITLIEAEKILGEKAELTDSSSETGPGLSIYKSAYSAQKDPLTGKTGTVYFMFEEYSSDTAAEKVYSSIKRSNEKNGINTLQGIGDEAYFHSDNENFYFSLARKGNKMIRIKVNKLTPKTSRQQFDALTKEITANM